MQNFQLGHFSVSRVGFGAMQLPGPGVFGPPRDRPEALAVLRRAVELGVDHIDTSQFYGPDVANELIREALYPYPAISRWSARSGRAATSPADGCATTSLTSCGRGSRTTCPDCSGCPRSPSATSPA